MIKSGGGLGRGGETSATAATRFSSLDECILIEIHAPPGCFDDLSVDGGLDRAFAFNCSSLVWFVVGERRELDL